LTEIFQYMAQKPSRFTITAALPYANGPVHIGHLAGVYVPADIYARYLRSNNKEVLFVCGSDEHGVPITIRARKEGVSPQEIVDKYHGIIKKAFSDFGITFDIYSRTSSKTHAETAADFFTHLYEKGEFVEQESEQYFDEQEQQFLADRYITGTCPVCGKEEAYGDQCESCGSSLSPTELKNPKSALSGNVPILKSTKHWYLPLDKYEPWLKEWIVEGHKNDWKTNVYGQCKSWIDQGLQPRAVTRDLDWGVPVPLADAKGKVLYVWFDAPIGYISATKDWAADNGKDWRSYWQHDDTRLLHFIGKDNIVFHCIIFPSMLKQHGDYILPDNVPANEFLNLEGDKISTSKNWAVWLHEYLEEFPGKQDVLRYTLCANAPETKDNDFTWKDYQARNNNELVAILGNFVNRAVVLTHKYFDGKIPECGELLDIDKKIINDIEAAPNYIATSLDKYRFREALSRYMELARAGNKYLADTEPWKLIKEDEGRVGTILNLALQIVANLAILGEPFLPDTAKKIFKINNTDKTGWPEGGSYQILSAGHAIQQPELLFEKVEDKVVAEQVEKLQNTKLKNEVAMTEVKGAKEEITYDDFAKLDIRIGTVLAAEKMPKSKKLLKLSIDTGIDQRTILSGISQQFEPEELIGKQVTVLVNLAPRKMMGIDSEGMVLMAEDATGELRLVAPETSVKNGSEVN
jgi:methionyl-tRNA synthetase